VLIFRPLLAATSSAVDLLADVKTLLSVAVASEPVCSLIFVFLIYFLANAVFQLEVSVELKCPNWVLSFMQYHYSLLT
jgi:hypothetical protein